MHFATSRTDGSHSGIALNCSSIRHYAVKVWGVRTTCTSRWQNLRFPINWLDKILLRQVIFREHTTDLVGEFGGDNLRSLQGMGGESEESEGRALKQFEMRNLMMHRALPC